jgi:DNA integrity scanning protein DisA with diadenylate cyclase activity
MGSADSGSTDALFKLLIRVDARACPDFSGTGLIVSERPDDLPILALRPISDPEEATDVADKLAEISNPAHEHHDGFHVLSPNLRLVRLAQYFSPPIVPSAAIDRSKRFGGRYLAALFGSALPGVLATGVASRDFGIAVFRDGREIRYLRANFAEATAGKASAS